MAALPLDDILLQLTNESQGLQRGTGNSEAAGALTTSAAAIAYDPDSNFSIPLQVLQHALHHDLLVSIETVQGYLYQGTLAALDPYCNLTIRDVSVFRRRIPHADFQQGSMLHANGTPMGFRDSVLLRGPQIVLVTLPSDELKAAYVNMARSVRRHLQKQKKASAPSPAAAPQASSTGSVVAKDDHTNGRGARSSGRGGGGRGGATSASTLQRKKINAKKVLFRKDKQK